MTRSWRSRTRWPTRASRARDAQGQLGEFNQQARLWHGLDPTTVPTSEWAQHFSLHDADQTRLLATAEVPLVRALNGEHVIEAEVVICATGQAPCRVLCNAEPLHGRDGMALGAVCVMYDVSRLRASLGAARVESQRLRDAFSHAIQGTALVSLDADGDHVHRSGWLQIGQRHLRT